MATDPEPVVTPFRVFVFVSALVTALSQAEAIPVNIKPWLILAGIVIDLAVVTFFGTPSNPSVASRVVRRLTK